MARSGAQVVGLQETRAHVKDLPAKVVKPRGWHPTFCCAERPGYSGVALFSRLPCQVEDLSLPDHFAREGRAQSIRVGSLRVVNAYFPNGSGKNRDHSRIPYKLEFYQTLLERLQPGLEAGERILVMGDFNTALEEIDLARPKSNHRTSGFTPIERQALGQWLRAGWVDTFRHQTPVGGHYTWWPNRHDCRARNIGWRIDLVLATPATLPFLERAFISSRVQGSDHCPVGVDLNPEVLGLG